MDSLEKLKGERIHTRSIRIETFRVDEERGIVEGILEDERFVVTHTLTGKRREPGEMHGMVVRLLVGEIPSRILDAEAEMPTVPLDGCDSVVESVKKLIGMPIVYGFSKAVKDKLGGTEGCTHLTSLVLTMGAAVVQGMAVNRGRKQIQPQAREIMLQYVKNSCWVWREDGKTFRTTLEEIKNVK